jgi:tetratricopeptide (TPR) repeat protein
MVTVLLATITLTAALLAPFDRLLLKDGRSIEGKVVPSDVEGYTRLRINEVEIPIRNDLIDKTWIEDLEDYVPQNEKEEEYLKKGWVLFEGRWMSKKRRDDELKKRADEDRKYIEAVKKRQDWRNAVTLETRHFRIQSNLDDELLQRYADLLEAYYKAFVDFWGITLSPGDKKGKPRVFLYRHPEDFYKITGVSRGVGGFFSPVDLELHLPHDPEDPARAQAVLFHEGNHLLTHLISPDFRYPIWMNEGMAEYYGTAELTGDGDFVVGRQQDGRIAGMRREKERGQFRRLRDVLLTEQGDFDAYDYAYAWSLVHYLMQSPDYGKTFKGFFGNLPENRDLEITRRNIYGYDREAVGMVELRNVLEAFEKRIGKSIDEIEQEWLVHFEQAYGELGPEAYYRAAQLEMYSPREDGSHIQTAVEFFEKAIQKGIQNSRCYRDFAELLRKGGVLESAGEVYTELPPDQARAWAMIEKAIELDPIDPLNYCEAAGILLMNGPLQDVDRAAAMAETASALAGPRNLVVRSLVDELMSLIEPARERARQRAEREAELAASDRRNWHVAFFFFEGQAPPDNLEDLTTAELRELIRAGKVTGRDYVFQTWMDEDPTTGELVQGDEPWDREWVQLENVPVFAEDLQAASGG